MQKWDHRALVKALQAGDDNSNVIGRSIEEMIKLGQEGWELVTVLNTGYFLIHYFKRPFQPERPTAGVEAPIPRREL